MMKRIFVVYGVLMLFCTALIVNLYGISSGISISKMAFSFDEKRYISRMVTRNLRGPIYDYELKPMVNKETEYVTVIEPQYFKEWHSSTLAELFSCDPLIIDQKIKKEKPFFQISQYPIEMEGIISFARTSRYGAQPLAPHVIGYTDINNATGLSGFERIFDDWLKTDQIEQVSYMADARGRSLSVLGLIPPQNAQEELPGIRTTLDADIQTISQTASESLGKGAVVVMEVKTGFIKAIVSRPTFDPVHIEQYLDSKEGEFINRAFVGYPLGSVFKTVTCAVAIDSGLDVKEYNYYCSGEIAEGDHIFSCLKKQGHGDLNLERAFALSCNPYFVNLIQYPGWAQKIEEYAKKLGFGQEIVLYQDFKTQPGQLTQLENLTEPAQKANFVLGQGDLMVTPLQVAHMMSIIANDGVDVGVNLLYSKVNSDKNDVENLMVEKRERVLSEETAKEVQRLLRYAVTNGTGYPAEIPAKMAGKTGSAEAGAETHGWFCGFFPYENPQYVICVIEEDGKTGGGSAAPIVREIAQKMVESGKVDS
jgi:cell division protein FtsI/penicillin-binding protein 2